MASINGDSIGHTLAALFIISTFYEVAMSALFQWRVYQVHLKGKGAKVPVSITVAILVFWEYDLDLFTPLLTALGYDRQTTYGGIVLTALLIAGGSGGINSLFERMGIRKSRMVARPDLPDDRHNLDLRRSPLDRSVDAQPSPTPTASDEHKA